MSLADQGCSDDLGTIGCHENCSNWLWEVIAILDGSTIHQTYGIVVLVTPLKLLRKQFIEVLEKNELMAISMTVSNSNNELFEVCVIFTC
jgi:hypothetical protein